MPRQMTDPLWKWERLIDPVAALALPVIDRGAHFSADMRYRWSLWRMWDTTIAPVTFCMLNPSTADATKNDPTVERCERRARMMGFGGIVVVNIFGLRSTDPRGLYEADDPIGTHNLDAIMHAVAESDMAVLGWGDHGRHMNRGQNVLTMLRGEGHGPKLHHLGLNKSGEPRHPLYVSYNVSPRRWVAEPGA